MQLAVIGINHRTAPVSLREQMAFAPAQMPDAYAQLIELNGVNESVIISTCNRVEICTSLSPFVSPIDELTDFLCDFHKTDARWFQQHFYLHEGRAAVEHVFEVASGLDSMVLGETQILSQVKDAYAVAQQHNGVGTLLHQLFQQAFRVAKRVRTETTISQGRVSVSSVAVSFAAKIIGDLGGTKVLIIGTGETGELTLVHLLEHGAKTALVANRTFERAEELARKHGAEAITFDQLPERLAEADIIISSTGAPHYVVRPDDVRNALARRRNRALILIDIAVPRDIDPAVEDIDNVYLYNIDELQSVVEENRAARERDLDVCRDIIRGEARQFMSTSSASIAGPVLQQLQQAAETIQADELKRLMAKLGNVSEKDRQEIQYAMHRVVNKMLHNPKAAIGRSTREAHGPTVIEVVRRLFGLSTE